MYYTHERHVKAYRYAYQLHIYKITEDPESQ